MHDYAVRQSDLMNRAIPFLIHNGIDALARRRFVDEVFDDGWAEPGVDLAAVYSRRDVESRPNFALSFAVNILCQVVHELQIAAGQLSSNGIVAEQERADQGRYQSCAAAETCLVYVFEVFVDLWNFLQVLVRRFKVPFLKLCDTVRACSLCDVKWTNVTTLRVEVVVCANANPQTFDRGFVLVLNVFVHLLQRQMNKAIRLCTDQRIRARTNDCGSTHAFVCCRLLS